MGYNYDWTSRAYHDHDRSPVPPDLESLARMFAATSLRYLHQLQQQEKEAPDEQAPLTTKFTGSACIVNFYNVKSMMGGHRDDSEFAVDKPIVSFSLGRPAVFLLGGPTRDDTPIVPILIRPGDVMLMGGSTRLNYHAMARLLPASIHNDIGHDEHVASTTKTLSEDDPNNTQYYHLPRPNEKIRSFPAEGTGDEKNGAVVDPAVPVHEVEPLHAFLAEHRININLRQVYHD